jgi:hypothetical protein
MKRYVLFAYAISLSVLFWTERTQAQCLTCSDVSTSDGYSACGTVSNGCGGTEFCGCDTFGYVCLNNGIADSCCSRPPLYLCNRDGHDPNSYQYCGPLGNAPLTDDCGFDIDCSGPCGPGRVCVASGTAFQFCCLPQTCAQAGNPCGNFPDGCGGYIHCGTCGTGQACDPTTAHCCQATSCASVGATCGVIDNGCHSEELCGTCPQDQECVNNNCVECPSPSCLGKTCGLVSNGCGQDLLCKDPSVSQAGICPTGLSCVNNVCTAAVPALEGGLGGAGPFAFGGTLALLGFAFARSRSKEESVP